MSNVSCYWCDYPIDKIGTEEEGYYCTFTYGKEVACDLDKPCFRYIAEDKVSEYIRHLISEIEFLESTFKLPQEDYNDIKRYFNHV